MVGIRSGGLILTQSGGGNTFFHLIELKRISGKLS